MPSGPAAGAGPLLLLLLVLGAASATPTPSDALAAAAVTNSSPRASQQQQQQQQHPQPQPLLTQPRLVPVAGGSVAPVLANYSFAGAQDTFELCRQQAGMAEGQDVPLEDLLALFHLPRDLAKHKAVRLAQLVELLHAVQPDFRVVYEPMLSGEADVARLLDHHSSSSASSSSASSSGSRLPRLVHFTVKDKNALAPHQVLSMASWAHHNPGHSLMLFDDADVRGFMATYYPALLGTFDGLGSQVERTDMWRYLVLCRLGGVYADSDVVAARPIAHWAGDAGLLVGVENVFTTPEEARERSYSRQVQMVQWSIAAAPGHPVVCRMGQYVAQHVAQERGGQFLDPDRDHAILERTGPGIWSDSVHDYLLQVGNVTIDQLVAGGRVGDVRVLPQTVLGCPTAVFSAADQIPYAYHMFKGSWRLTQPTGLTAFVRKLKSSLHHHQQTQQQAQLGEPAAVGTAQEAAARAAAAVAAAAASAAVHGTKAPAAIAVPGSGAAAAVVTAAGAGAKRPRLPILDEQILAHKAQQQLLEQQQPHKQVQRESPAHAQHAARHAKARQQVHRLPQAVRLPATAAPVAAASSSVQQQQQAQSAAAAASLPQQGVQQLATARKLRSSQLLLVKGVPPAYAAAGGLSEPDLPSQAVGGMHALSLLVVMLLVVAVCWQRRGGSSGASWLLVFAVDGSGSGAAKPARLSRPSSRSTLTASSAALPGLPGATLPPSGLAADGSKGGSSSGGLSRQDRLSGSGAHAAALLQQDVCLVASSSDPAGGRSHRHKRSWGSSTSFQQL